MKRFALMIWVLAGTLFAAEELPIRLDVTSQPNGSAVMVDGAKRGVTPLTLIDLKPGCHLVTVSSANHLPQNEFITLAPGAFLQKNYELTPEKGILLVRTEPAGCDVTYNGLSLGVTPLLVTSIDSGRECQITLSQNGYQSKTVNFTLEGRRPYVVNETLASDSGALVITTEPSGANVVVNGVDRGFSPVTVERLPKGTATVSVKKEGYDVDAREVRIRAGETQNLAVVLKGRPARVSIVTVPEKARVYVDGEFSGLSPINVVLAAGSHRFSATLAGYAAAEETFNVEVGAKVTREYQLRSQLAKIDIRTSPVGAEVWIDNKKIGKTKNSVSGANVSEVMTIDGLLEGEHLVEVKMKGCETASKRVELVADRTQPLKVTLKRMFIPDCEVVTYSGSTYTGIKIGDSVDGGVVIELRPGIERPFKSSEIKEIRYLDQ